MLSVLLAGLAMAGAHPAAVLDGRYRGAAPGAPAIVARVTHGRVAAFSVAMRSYRCELGGDIGPVRVRVEPGAAVGRDGRIAFVAGSRVERLRVEGRVVRGALRGRLRVFGTIATGEPCASRRIAFAIRRAGR